MITTTFFVLVAFLKRAPRIIIHLARNAEKGGKSFDVNHTSQLEAFISPQYFSDSASGSASGSGFPISWFSIGHYRNVRGLGKSMVVFRLFEKLRYSNERSTIF